MRMTKPSMHFVIPSNSRGISDCFGKRFRDVSTKPVLSEVEGLDMTSYADASIRSFIRLQPQIIALQSF
jgi:hypothetical protein